MRLALLVLLFAVDALAQSSSPSFRLVQSTANGGGTSSISTAGTAFRLTSSLGQESAIGTSSSFGFVLQSGFWSFQGSGFVPVLLAAHKNGTSSGQVDLSWTGNNPPYALYATADCSNVTSGFLAASFRAPPD